MKGTNKVEDALAIVATPIDTGRTTNASLMMLLEEAVRGIVEEAPRRGLCEAAPNVEGLANLVRVLVAAHKHGVGYSVIGFLKCQIIRLEGLIKEHPGDPASACVRLGFVIARALELAGRADDESYPVPAIFRLSTADWPFPAPVVA